MLTGHVSFVGILLLALLFVLLVVLLAVLLGRTLGELGGELGRAQLLSPLLDALHLFDARRKITSVIAVPSIALPVKVERDRLDDLVGLDVAPRELCARRTRTVHTVLFLVRD